MEHCGYFGKRPLERDFVFEGLTAGMTDAWANLMSDWLISAQSAFPNDWQQFYFDAPAWRYAIAPGLLGPSGWCGLLCASADTVGRAFPLAVMLPTEASNRDIFFDAETERALDALEIDMMAFIDGQVSRSEFHTTISEHAKILGNRQGFNTGTPDELLSAQNEALCLRYARTGDEAIIAESALSFRSQAASKGTLPLSFWWQDGSDARAPELCVWKGLPRGSGTGGFFAGSWETFGWQNEQIDPDRILRL